jgi:hypothetical protein
MTGDSRSGRGGLRAGPQLRVMWSKYIVAFLLGMVCTVVFGVILPATRYNSYSLVIPLGMANGGTRSAQDLRRVFDTRHGLACTRQMDVYDPGVVTVDYANDAVINLVTEDWTFGFPFSCAHRRVEEHWSFGAGVRTHSDDAVGMNWPFIALTIPMSWSVPGLIADAFLCGLLLLAGAALVRWLRAWLWRRSGRCPSCGYHLAGLGSGEACPECGKARYASREDL